MTIFCATEEEKQYQIEMLVELEKINAVNATELLHQLQTVAIKNHNMFDSIMEATKYCSLGQVTNALFEVGGQYRRNM